MAHRGFFISVLGIALTHSAMGWAQSQQPWLQDRRFSEGAGVRTGNLELHPGIAAQVGYDSNYYQGSNQIEERAPRDYRLYEPEVDTLRLRVTPSLSLSTLSPQRRAGDREPAHQKLDFRAGLSASYNEIIAVDSQYSKQTSKQRHVSGTAGLDLDILPHEVWGADLKGEAVAMRQPTNDPTLDGQGNPSTFNRYVFYGGAGINFRPGGGMLTWRLGGDISYTSFIDSEFEALDNSNIGVVTSGRWKFLPRTAMLYRGRLGFISFQKSNTNQVSSKPIESQLGLSGLVTNHFGLLGMAGWHATFYEADASGVKRDYDGPVGQAELTWYPMPTPQLEPGSAPVGLSTIALGYMRKVQNGYLGNFIVRDRVYTGLNYFAGGVVLVKLEGGFSRIKHPASVFPDSSPQAPSFSENRVDALAFGEYRLSDSFGLNLTLTYNAALTSRRIPVDTAMDPAIDQLKFNRFEAWLGARYFL